MAYNSISIKPYFKSHLELQREITQIELAPSPYFFVLSICLAYINMFARFNENPAMTLQDIKETKRYGQTHGRTHGQWKTVYPPQTKFAGGIIMQLKHVFDPSLLKATYDTLKINLTLSFMNIHAKLHLILINFHVYSKEQRN